jgi:nitrate/nitrite transport system ATP-binding protein
MLSVEDVSKGYSRGEGWREVLSDVCLEVAAGEVGAVIGGRLTGKTTLLRIVAGLELPDKGSVSLEGKPLEELGDVLGSKIVWIDGSRPDRALDVVSFVGWPIAAQCKGRRVAERLARRALDRVGATECIARRWDDLSDRERVLVALARAFVGEPTLIVIDDLLDALGTRPTEEISDLLRSLLEESEPRCAVLMSASDMESAMYADRVWSISRKGTLKGISGQLRADGEIIDFPGEAHNGA